MFMLWLITSAEERSFLRVLKSLPILVTVSLNWKETSWPSAALFAWMGIKQISGIDAFAYNCEKRCFRYLFKRQVRTMPFREHQEIIIILAKNQLFM